MSLYVRDTNGDYTLADKRTLKSALRNAFALKRGVACTNPAVAYEFLWSRLVTAENEKFCVMFLDSQHKLIEFRVMFEGTIDACTVHPREVIKAALLFNAAALIIAHNHPSGNAEPSNLDIEFTKRLITACELVDIRVLDHIIIGNEASVKHVSMAERRLL